MKKLHDPYFHKAKREGYAARSVYKLEEIDRRLRLLRPGQAVLDLGCRPGSWMQFAAARVGPTGRVVGVDLHPIAIALPANAVALQTDAAALDAATLSAYAPAFHVVLSDMAPDTTGVALVDQARSLALCETALAVARRILAPRGALVVKLFQGSGFPEFVGDVRRSFAEVTIEKPAGSRKESKEIYIVGRGFRGGAAGPPNQGNRIDPSPKTRA
jgi:23S rRNA (uridine2552-2'-O)-methyltransferase